MRISDVISSSVKDALLSFALICGYIIFFSVISVIAKVLFSSLIHIFVPSLTLLGANISRSFIEGVFEMSSGIFSLSKIKGLADSYKLILSAFMLGFSGLCVMFQIFSIATKEKLSMKKYFIIKISQAVFSAVIAFILFKLSPISVPTFSPLIQTKISLPTISISDLFNHSVGLLAFTLLVLFTGSIILYFIDILFSQRIHAHSISIRKSRK